jgi:hypothetical protein
MRKTYITETVLQCPEAWQIFCQIFPGAVVAEDVGNQEVLLVYTDNQRDTS